MDDFKLIGCFEGFIFYIWGIEIVVGVGFLVLFSGNMMCMLGLFVLFVVLNIDIDDEGVIFGLF